MPTPDPDEYEPGVPDGDAGLVRLRLDVAYDGTDFSGWAPQPDRRTVAGVLLASLAQVLSAPADTGEAVGSPAARLTVTIGFGRSLFVHDGDEIAFATHEVPNLVSIVQLKPSDDSRRRLHPRVTAQ